MQFTATARLRSYLNLIFPELQPPFVSERWDEPGRFEGTATERFGTAWGGPGAAEWGETPESLLSPQATPGDKWRWVRTDQGGKISGIILSS